MARLAACLLAAGALLGLSLLAFPHAPEPNQPAQLLLILAALVLAGVLLARGDRFPPWTFQALVAGGTALITSSIYYSRDTTNEIAFLYLFVALFAAHFFTRRETILQMAFVAVAYGGVLLTQQSLGAAAGRWVVTIGSLGVAAVVVRLLSEGVERVVGRLSDASLHDPLTGLLNRRGFHELLEKELDRARRSGRPLSLLLGDLDRLKALNHRLGDRVGDSAIKLVRALLLRAKRQIDLAARIGEDEFALIVPESDEHGAYLLAERLRVSIQETFAGHQLPITASFGVATFPKHGQTAQALLTACDEAVRAAGELGRNRTVLHSPEVAGILTGAENRHAGQGEVQLATVLTLAEALDIRDTGTAKHSQTVARYAEAMARQLDLPDSVVDRVRLAGVVHDVGKIGVRDSILSKPAALSDEEWLEMRKHPEIGARLLGNGELDDIRAWVLAHHERPDGRGYPQGLRGSDIPIEAKILAVADAYEAMTSNRAYRPALGHDRAREEIRCGAGTQFDEDVVQAWLRFTRLREVEDATELIEQLPGLSRVTPALREGPA